MCYEFRPIGGGGAKVAENLIEQMLARGDEVDLVTMGYGDLPRVERNGRLTIHRVPCGRRRDTSCEPHEMLVYTLRAMPLALRLIRERRPHINHTHFIFPDGVLAMLLAKLRGLRFIVTTHGSDVPGYNPHRFMLLHRLLRPLWRQVVRSADLVICPSDYLKGLLLQAAPDTKCQVIPNGIDVAQYSPSCRREKRILVVSRIVERKGVQYLIKALSDLEHDYEVCVVGDGPYLEKLKALADELAVKVTFTGFIDNRSDQFLNLLQTSQVFVFTSSAENFPVVLLEAMSAGLCIITTNDTGCSEVVGETAVRIPPQDVDALRQALIRVMDDSVQREALGRQARFRVEQLFTQEHVADLYHRAYDKHAMKYER